MGRTAFIHETSTRPNESGSRRLWTSGFGFVGSFLKNGGFKINYVGQLKQGDLLLKKQFLLNKFGAVPLVMIPTPGVNEGLLVILDEIIKSPKQQEFLLFLQLFYPLFVIGHWYS